MKPARLWKLARANLSREAGALALLDDHVLTLPQRHSQNFFQASRP